MKIYDVVIIGGGVTGSAIARELSRYKLKTALLEKEEELAFGVSKSNSGIIHPGTQNPSNSLKGRLCLRGNILSKKIARDLGIDLQEVGELIVAMSESEIPGLIEIKNEAEKLGVPGIRIVGPEWLRENEPNLTQEAVCALYAPTAGIISPYRWVYDFCENAEVNGVEIHRGTQVMSINRVKGQGSRGKGGENAFEINTTKEAFKAQFVVNAAGLYADDIAEMAGISDFKIKPRRGEEFILDKKRHNITNHLIFPMPTAASKGILIIKTSDGNPMIGPTAEEVESKEDLSTTEEGLKKVLEAGKRLVPSIDENDIIAYFAGLRPASGDDFIIRYEDKVPGMVTVAGIQSPGLTAAPAIAEMVAGLLCKNGLRLKKKFFFRAHRRELNHLFAIPFSRTKRLIKKDASYGDIVCRCEMVSAKEIRDAISRGATTLDGVKFRTRAQAGRCHGSFCTTRIMKILSEETGKPILGITKRGCGSEMLKGDRKDTR